MLAILGCIAFRQSPFPSKYILAVPNFFWVVLNEAFPTVSISQLRLVSSIAPFSNFSKSEVFVTAESGAVGGVNAKV